MDLSKVAKAIAYEALYQRYRLPHGRRYMRRTTFHKHSYTLQLFNSWKRCEAFLNA